MARKVIISSGKRKMAVARARVEKGVGRIRINSVPIEIIQPELVRLKLQEPLSLAEKHAAKLDIKVDVVGGGIMGQADAARTAIARGIVEFTGDDDLKQKYLYFDRTLLVNDTRRKEAKKQLGRGARKKRQKSYR